MSQSRDFSVMWNRIVTIASCVIFSSCLCSRTSFASVRPNPYGRQSIDVSKMRAARTKLPSETAKEKKERFLEKPLIKRTLKAVPIVLVTSGIGYLGYQAYRLSERRKIEKWQQVLQRQFQTKDVEEANSTLDEAEVAIEKNLSKEDSRERRLDELSRLELFHKRGEMKDLQVDTVAPELTMHSTDLTQSLILEYLKGVIDVTEWNERIERLGRSKEEVVQKTREFCTSYLNAILDKSAKFSDTNDKTRIETMLVLVDQLEKLETFSNQSSIASDLSDEHWLKYSGTANEKEVEAAYRLLAIHFFSSESRIKDGMEKLPFVQRYLKLSDEKFHNLNQEVAKAIFQVAVSNTLSEGKLDDESREALETLKRSFTKMIDNESAENIISEVGLMRVMYALQQILKEQQFGDEDIQMLKSMCEQLGVDLESLLKTAEDMGDNMGPQVKEFVHQLRSFLSKTSKE
ncbi:uncharacterized protein Gasu_15150 [Galdieria sulphuraria]|uniref:Uncharacterized protein n=1 Tax=Galdieria sulphuraria TaxID=130081 RepID=M2W691_GALSU|nr:uncharacterized protein Gasu_15150 [Galdieria sulphuraria]EME31276.1 hypothetical protein Gasu_15150 [Galdieria sulphuraria]|eukprot:XP_005707796.1 hypothetical protein Gasu_15150 [Galdieria sulphuraria]